jgi:hypothetical protein
MEQTLPGRDAGGTQQSSQFAEQAGILSPPCRVGCGAVLWCVGHILALVAEYLERFVEEASDDPMSPVVPVGRSAKGSRELPLASCAGREAIAFHGSAAITDFA